MTIFISIASYNDPELFNTINDSYAKAERAHNLRYGVFDQNKEDRYDLLPKWRDQIRYMWVKDRDARGVGFARSVIQGMMEEEDYLLQIDSHMRFETGWDTLLTNQMNELPWKSILTGSPMPWSHDSNPKQIPEGKVIKLTGHKNNVLRNAAVLVKSDQANGHMEGDRIAAGCLFSRGCLYDHIPYDPHIYFNGEEYLFAQRALELGWHIYYPRQLPIYHLYKKANENQNLVHWGATTERYWDPQGLRSKGEIRIANSMKGGTGIYSINTALRRSANGDFDFTSNPNSDPNTSSESNPYENQELRELLRNIELLTTGKQQPIKAGRNSLATFRIKSNKGDFFIKVIRTSLDKDHTINRLLSSDAIKSNQKNCIISKPIWEILSDTRSYSISDYIKHTSLAKAAYPRIFESLFIFNAIGEFNGLNRNREVLRDIEKKEFRLVLSLKRLARRFPNIDEEILIKHLEKARSIYETLIIRIRDLEESDYSLSHNDLHRENFGIIINNDRQEKIVLFDFADSRWAPLGNDLQFFIYYLLRHPAPINAWEKVIKNYCHGLGSTSNTYTVKPENVLLGAIAGYADKWLNIHRRPKSSADWKIFNLCIEVCELFLNSNRNTFFSKVQLVAQEASDKYQYNNTDRLQ